ncbi:hypothetical protein [Rhodoferax sp.]|uniref:LolA family protein n=1 Tax=Rhodoferax sp. TaxID=50421 RepID=UPI0026272C05|nr:hypothetical protein [Rhodoferax sp.]MDD2918583.1 hypothetical protein [Rhodoferax sp.]
MSLFNKLWLTLASLGCLSLPATALEQDAASLALVDKVVQAYGGASQIERLVSLNADGLINAIVRNASGTYKRWFQRPRMLRVETVYPAATETRVLNGELAWRITGGNLMAGVEGPGRLAMIYQYKQLDLPYGLLKGRYNLRHAGSETIGNQATEVMDLRDDEGPNIRVNVDTATHLIVKVTGQIEFAGQTMVLAAEFSDFRPVDGMPLPFHINNYAGGMAISETLITRYAINPPVDATLFVPRVKGREAAMSESANAPVAVARN